jgi:hypothetical protein
LLLLKLNPIEPPWYGPVCPVVWEGRRREVSPYPDQSMITFDRNPSSRSTGLGDHLPPESVITFDRNTHGPGE